MDSTDTCEYTPLAMTFSKQTATRSLLVKGQRLTVEVWEFDQVQNFPVGGGTWIGFCTEFKIHGGDRDFLKVGVEPSLGGASPEQHERLLRWLPKAGFVTLIEVLCGRSSTSDAFVEVGPQGPSLLDPQRVDMRFFRKRCRYDVLRMISEGLSNPDGDLGLSVPGVLQSPVLTRLYEEDDIVSALVFWEKERLLGGLGFDNTCVIDENRDEDVVRLIAGYNWEETLVGASVVSVGKSDVFDVFICHASEDKESFVRELAGQLVRAGIKVWYDEVALSWGDSLRQKIDDGLTRARFGIVVLSKAFFAKQWPQYELDGLAQKEMSSGKNAILPIWHGVSKEEVERYSLPLAARVAITSEEPLGSIIAQVGERLKEP